MKTKYKINDISNTLKPEDAWWTVLIVDPIAIRITWLFANFTKIKPNHITLLSFFIGLISAWYFLQGEYIYLILGSIFFQFSFILDCVDGKLSKLTNNQTRLGYFLDYSLDRWRIFLNLFALSYGQYLIYNDNIYLILGFIYLFLNLDGLIQTFVEHNVKIGPKYIKENKFSYSNKSLENKLRGFFNKKRLIFGITDIETDMLIFFIFPLFNLVKFGLIISVSAMFLWLIFIRGVRLVIDLKKVSDRKNN